MDVLSISNTNAAVKLRMNYAGKQLKPFRLSYTSGAQYLSELRSALASMAISESDADDAAVVSVACSGQRFSMTVSESSGIAYRFFSSESDFADTFAVALFLYTMNYDWIDTLDGKFIDTEIISISQQQYLSNLVKTLSRIVRNSTDGQEVNDRLSALADDIMPKFVNTLPKLSAICIPENLWTGLKSVSRNINKLQLELDKVYDSDLYYSEVRSYINNISELNPNYRKLVASAADKICAQLYHMPIMSMGEVLNALEYNLSLEKRAWSPERINLVYDGLKKLSSKQLVISLKSEDDRGIAEAKSLLYLQIKADILNRVKDSILTDCESAFRQINEQLNRAQDKLILDIGTTEYKINWTDPQIPIQSNAGADLPNLVAAKLQMYIARVPGIHDFRIITSSAVSNELNAKLASFPHIGLAGIDPQLIILLKVSDTEND